jgi:hypothetical protein
MRYRLRTLLLMAALIPPAIAAAWYFGGCGKVGVSRYSQNAAIRSKLLAHTPPGTSAVDVLSFVITSLRHQEPVDCYFEYLQAYEASTAQSAPVVPTNSKTIEVIVTEWPAAWMMSELVIATWHFDDKNRVSDITIQRRTTGP